MAQHPLQSSTDTIVLHNTTPTSEAYAELQVAFDHFNSAIFEGALPSCLISLRSDGGSIGYFSGGRFVGRATGELIDEIALNAGYFGICPIREIMQTLVHEMVHQWQHHFGTPGRGRYHNREWADKMEAIGLMPSDTGAAGGKRTGDSVSDYVIDGGRFDDACRDLLTRDYTLSWLDRFPPKPPSPNALTSADDGLRDAVRLMTFSQGGAKPNKSNRVKYRCPICCAQAWGKPGLQLLCGMDGHRATPFEALNEQAGGDYDQSQG